MTTWRESQAMKDYVGGVQGYTLLQAIKEEASLSDEQWAKLYDSATPYQRRCARLILDPTAAPHGVDGTYTNWGCRCDLCTLAHSQARTGKAVLRDFGEDPVLLPGEVPEQIARLQEMVKLGQPLTEKGRALLNQWEADNALDSVI